ncbi:MAG TPA: TonB-dependent receptor [Gemmatimonadaceae bacterium]|nr:TonB-dependent receptor [Gemmatimonadaceae bacterium]
MTTVVWRACVVTTLCSSVAFGQLPGKSGTVDSAKVHSLDTVVVTPERSATSIRASTVAVTVLSENQLRQLPVRSVAASLALAPGVVVLDANSVGGNPRIIARGFYGGGETDYLPALVDGVPIAALGSGAVNWDLLPRTGFGRAEVVRGGSSYMRGDGAVSGTLNLLTDAQPPNRSWRVAGGAYGIRDATLLVDGVADSHRASLGFDHSASRGYRTHEERQASTLNGKLTRYGAAGTLTLFGSTHFRTFDDPGPLPSTTVDRRATNPFFRFDRASERVHRGGVSVSREVGNAIGSGYLVGEYSTANTIRTLPLSPDFADTKRRRTEAPRILSSVQFEVGDDSADLRGRLVAGLDGSIGRFTSRYADVASGTLVEYAAANGATGAPGEPSRVTRAAGAAFASWQLRPLNPVRFALSTRVDNLRDVFTPSRTSAAPEVHTSHNAVSPRAALNLELPLPADRATNVYFSVGRVFKAPTLDQLFDDRAIPIPFPPFSATVSNPLLSPQRGTSVETGFYSAWTIPGARLDISGAAYRERMRDELDFDVTSFRYVNIGRSFHRGVELGTKLTATSGALLFANLSRQSVLSESGQFEGRQLKAIPRTIVSAGADLVLWRGLTGGLLVTSLGGAFVDDANATPLPGYTRADVRVGVPMGPLRLTFDAMNALGRRYDATAFPDPAGSTITYRYPAAGRVFVLGLESR